MAIYAYADETIFILDNLTNQTALGCGIFISDTEIKQGLIREALYNLKSDPEFQTKLDGRTIKRKFFHASDDSKNAHSHLCVAINKHLKGVFDFSYFDNVTEKDLKNSKFRENIISRCLSASTLEFFNSPREVYLTVEQRQGYNDSDTSNWLQHIYHMYEGASYDIPSFKTFFPKITISLRGKREPGLQITDFLMWSVNRSIRKVPNATWLQRLKFTRWHFYRDENSHNRGQYQLNTLSLTNPSENYPFKFKKPETWYLCLEAYILIERFLIAYDIEDFPPHALHLFDEFQSISARLKDTDYHIKSEDLELIGSVFLKLFDTIPLYKDVENNNKEAWEILLYAKYLAAMFVRKERIHFHRTKEEIQRWRYMMQTERAKEFEQLRVR